MYLRPLPAAFVRHFLYTARDRLRAGRVLETLDRLEQSEWLSRSEIEEQAWRRLLEIVAYAGKHVPYYRDLLSRCGIDPARIDSPRDLEALPPLSAEIIRREGRRLVSADPLRRGYRTDVQMEDGERLRIWRDVAEEPVRRAGALRGYRWTGVDIGEPVAILRRSDTEGRFARRLEQARSYFKNILLLPAFGADSRSLGRAAAALRAWRPALLAGSVPALTELAGFYGREGIRPPQPRAIVAFGAALDPDWRRAVEEAFGAPVHARYQRPETSVLAMECRRGGLHMFADLFYVELLGEDGRAAEAGESGEIVVTGLEGRYMPLIRYRTGDRAVAGAGDCPCGRGLPLLELVERRLRAETAAPVTRADLSAERMIVKSKIHKAHVSAVDPGDIDCLRIDDSLLELGDIAPGERILIVNATSGARLETIALRAPPGSGVVAAGGAVAHLCRAQDEIGIMAFTWSGARDGRFSNILVDAENRFARFLTEKAGDML